jgi:hypothetical protein
LDDPEIAEQVGAVVSALVGEAAPGREQPVAA